MDDIDLDRKLQAALAVSPSPDFVARVRMKIADAPPPSVFAGWLKPAAAIACAAAVAIAGVTHQEETPAQAGLKPSIGPVTAGLKPSTTITPSTTSTRQVTDAPTAALAARGETVVVPTRRSAKSALVAASSAAIVEPPLPEVIIAPGDIEALRQFVTSAREGRFVASFDQTPAPIPWVTPEPADHNN